MFWARLSVYTYTHNSTQKPVSLSLFNWTRVNFAQFSLTSLSHWTQIRHVTRNTPSKTGPMHPSQSFSAFHSCPAQPSYHTQPPMLFNAATTPTHPSCPSQLPYPPTLALPFPNATPIHNLHTLTSNHQFYNGMRTWAFRVWTVCFLRVHSECATEPYIFSYWDVTISIP